jgi:hypothetical protein
MLEGFKLNITAEQVRQEILDLDDSLKASMDAGRLVSEIRKEYDKKSRELLISAAKSKNWDEIVDELSFFLFAGGMQDFAVQKLSGMTNQLIRLFNAAEIKISDLNATSDYMRSQYINVRSDFARNAALARVAKDPKQKALKEIETEFHKVSGQFKRRGYGAQFIREMADKHPIITDTKTISKLVARLKKELPSS